MQRRRSVARAALAASLSLVTAGAARAAGAQSAVIPTAPHDSAAAADARAEGAPRGICFRPRPGPACRAFWVVEAGVYPRLAGTDAARPWGARRQLGNHASWELGYMGNAGAASALGGAAFLGLNGAGARWGAKARYRRWLPGDFAVDIGAGPVSAVAAVPVSAADAAAADPLLFARGAGATADVAVSWRGIAGVTVRTDAVRARGTTARAVYGGVHLASGAAAAGTAAAALAVAAMLAALAYGGGG